MTNFEYWYFDFKKRLREKNCVFFCGAGISFNSGIPTSRLLLNEILTQLGFPKKDLTLFNESNLPFELVIELIESTIGEINNLLPIFNIGIPNKNHYLLARLAKKGLIHTICTTNFDCHIENAMVSEGLIRGIDFEVYFNDNHFKDYSAKSEKVCILKIHGSIEDYQSIAITLSNVSSHLLQKERMLILKNLFDNGLHSEILILGYSCSDVFDIIPEIKKYKNSDKNVTYISHNESLNSLTKSKIEDIKFEHYRNPFSNYIGNRIKISTECLVNQVWSDFIPCEYSAKVTNEQTTWSAILSNWLNSIPKNSYEKLLFFASLYFHIGKLELAYENAKQALSLAKELKDTNGQITTLHSISIYLAHQGKLTEANGFIEQAYKLALESNAEEKKINSLQTTKAYILSQSGGATKDIYEYCLVVAENNSHYSQIIFCSGQLGWIEVGEGNYEKGMEYYWRALHFSKQIGDVSQTYKLLANIASLFNKARQFPYAAEYFSKSLTLANECDDKASIGSLYFDLSVFACNLNEVKLAQIFCELAIVYYNITDSHSLKIQAIGLLNQIKETRKNELILQHFTGPLISDLLPEELGYTREIDILGEVKLQKHIQAAISYLENYQISNNHAKKDA